MAFVPFSERNQLNRFLRLLHFQTISQVCRLAAGVLTTRDLTVTAQGSRSQPNKEGAALLGPCI